MSLPQDVYSYNVNVNLTYCHVISRTLAYTDTYVVDLSRRLFTYVTSEFVSWRLLTSYISADIYILHCSHVSVFVLQLLKRINDLLTAMSDSASFRAKAKYRIYSYIFCCNFSWLKGCSYQTCDLFSPFKRSK